MDAPDPAVVVLVEGPEDVRENGRSILGNGLLCVLAELLANSASASGFLCVPGGLT